MASENLKKKEISARIALAVERSGRKAKDIAAALGVSEVTMSKYVNGVSTPKNDYLISLSQELNVSVSWILSGKDEPFPADTSPSYEEWKRRALEAEKKLAILRGVIPMLNEVNNVLSKNL
ncbi:MAG: helix-turn-helix transcriptional regulator [Akkermansia sp.]|nr:helix-turn-helix transcriptional regulator [Akkermansia sp.]MBQ8516486.1 helix-turn-helix transcriptional regulator [Akkermansia sp.]